MIRTQINLDDSQYHLLVQMARQQNRSLSEIVRESLDDKMRKKQTLQEPSLLEALAKSATSMKTPKKFPGKTYDDHDRYLYGPKSPKWGYLWKKGVKK